MNQLLKNNLEHVLKHKIKELLVQKDDELKQEERPPEPWVRETMNLDKNVCRMDKEPKLNYARVRNEPLEKRAQERNLKHLKPLNEDLNQQQLCQTYDMHAE